MYSGYYTSVDPNWVAVQKEKECGYGILYDWILETLYSRKQVPLRVLEIGCAIWNGSAFAFSEVSCIGKYVGIDIEGRDVVFPEGVDFICADAYTPETVEKVRELEKFDLIIDDGSHAHDDMLFVCNNYGEFLSSEGILVIEDCPNVALEMRKEQTGFKKPMIVNTKSPIVDDAVCLVCFKGE